MQYVYTLAHETILKQPGSMYCGCAKVSLHEFEPRVWYWKRQRVNGKAKDIGV